MYLLPKLSRSASAIKRDILEFKGINLGNMPQDGELRDSLNISADEYPCLSPRLPRKVIKESLTNPSTIFSKNDKLAVVDGTSFIYDGTPRGSVTAGPKQIASIGNRIVIFPDKKYYDTRTNTFGVLEATQIVANATFAANKITTPGASFIFTEGDSVIITGCTYHPANNKTVVIKSVSGQTLNFADNTFEAGGEPGNITLKREVPDMDFICEYNNRIWGCKGNTIYGSKQGDPFNYNVFQGVSTDSYSVDVGSPGEFTGLIGYTSHLVFFKENYIHKLFGSKPSNFQIVTSQCSGIQPGSHNSVVNVNDTIIYKATNGIMVYTGNVPELISDKFGNERYTNAVAAADARKYYVCLKKGLKYVFMVYDIAKNIWIKEDETFAESMVYHDGHVIYLSGTDNKVYSCDDETGTEVIKWSATLAESTENIVLKKGFLRFFINAELKSGASLRIYINYDRKGWVKIYSGRFNDRKSIKIPVIPERCDMFSLRLEGEGKCKIYSVTRETQVRGEP